MKNAKDYQVTRPTVPAQGIGMPYLTLDEAAQYATEQKGFKVEPSVLLRSGVLGALPICAAFGAGRMHNAITQQEEDLTPCLLIIPPKHLLELETEGTATIHLAHSLDGEKMLFPEKQRTREHLRVMVAHLDKFLEMLIDTTQETNTPAAMVETLPDTSPSGDDVEEQAPAKERSISKSAVINAFEGLHFDRNGWNNALSDVPNWIEPCRVTLGRKGDKTTPATWNPALIAAALFDKAISIKKLDAVFVRLKDWADEWREVSESFRD